MTYTKPVRMARGSTARLRPTALARQAQPRFFRNQRPQAPRGAVIAKSGVSIGPCVDVAWLQRNLEDVRVYDVRGSVSEPDAWGAGGCSADYDAYLEGHIPGAVFVSWVRDAASWQPGADSGSSSSSSAPSSSGSSSAGAPKPQRQVLAVLVDPDAYVPCFEARGLSAERPVVVYDNGTNMIAARVWWQLLLYGHPSPYVLHGGWDAWRSAGGGSELYEPCPLKLSSVYDAEPQLRYRASPEEFRLAATHGSADDGGTGEEPAVVAVLLMPESYDAAPAADAPAAQVPSPSSICSSGHDDLPRARRLSLPALLRACTGVTPTPTSTNTEPTSTGSNGGIGGSLPPWTAVAAAASAHGSGGGGALAARLAAALGAAVGPASRTRLLLASPHDAALSACAVGALLHAAGHGRWAVCEEVL
ncbi:hypothetical protein PLESTB_001095200 [Pleodorina starrii]|uniref:Rhodanese domain-containing protein n=1 Tax=Pleodorina starrii TaxID=330485 RepID=A0A9W6BQH9_9CHLO|nr:hypothetical protein PLESTM_000692100 [Pleodorina starrii]GLC56349.1 hypothetical protein PLESTB_001095200 [Pleodorina starrii]GLC77184.1 hypothetical protein PLESTF_001895300 [Pleodorina starrii]